MSTAPPRADTGEVGLNVNEDPVRVFEVRWRPFDSPADAGGSGRAGE